MRRRRPLSRAFDQRSTSWLGKFSAGYTQHLGSCAKARGHQFLDIRLPYRLGRGLNEEQTERHVLSYSDLAISEQNAKRGRQG
jgi:hypothetical protein